MNKYITKTIRTGFVFGVAIFMTTSTAFASANLVPAGATEITNTSATLNGQVVNENANSSVWFEWSDNASFYAPSIVGKQAFWGGRMFDATITGLTPGTTYYYRAVAFSRTISGGADAPVYSPVVSFKTSAPKVVSSVAGAGAPTSYGNGTATTKSTNTNNTTSNSKSVAATKTATQTVDESKNGFSNNGSDVAASAIGAGNGILPTTLIGWVAFLITIVVAILIGRLIYEENEKRKKKKAAKKAGMVVDGKELAAA